MAYIKQDGSIDFSNQTFRWKGFQSLFRSILYFITLFFLTILVDAKILIDQQKKKGTHPFKNTFYSTTKFDDDHKRKNYRNRISDIHDIKRRNNMNRSTLQTGG